MHLEKLRIMNYFIQRMRVEVEVVEVVVEVAKNFLKVGL
jgi:hypothetical protein